MKAHGIQTSGAGGGLKKESKDSKDGIKSRAANKRRKLAAVDEDAGDVDEPIKTEVKGEVKTEDSIAVKAEQESGVGSGVGVGVTTDGGLAAVPSAATMPIDGAPPTGAPNNTSVSTTEAQNGDNNDDDDDDEVQVISATERRDDGSNSISVYGSGGHHHSHSHSPHTHSPTAPMIPGIHSFDYAANNMGFPPQQMSGPTRMSSSPSSMHYGFAPNTWMYPHDAHGYL